MDSPSAPAQIGCAEMVDDSAPSPGNLSATTRPNPFDDEDISARKRRRTSGSPTPPLQERPVRVEATRTSADNAPEQPEFLVHKQSQPSTDGISESMVPGAIDEANAAAAPTTPEAEVVNSPQEIASPVSSSKVTINLKRAQEIIELPEDPSEPAVTVPRVPASPPQPIAARDSGSAMDVADTPNISVSASPSGDHVALSDAGDDGEVNTELVDDSGDSMTMSADETTTSALPDYVPEDPTELFPYVEIEENPLEPLQRLIQYFLSDHPIEANILSEIRKWTCEYLQYAKFAPVSEVLESRKIYCRIWYALPDAVVALSSKRFEIAKLPALREQTIGLLADFASLSSCMTSLDYAETNAQTTSGGTDIQQVPEPELYSPKFLQRLHDVLLPSSAMQGGRDDAADIMEQFDNDLAFQVLDNLESSPTDILLSFKQLALTLKSRALLYPKLPERLAPLVYVTSDVLRRATYVAAWAAARGTVPEMEAMSQLRIADEIWAIVSSSFDLVVEKRCSQITPEAAPVMVDALTDLLKCCLHGDNQHAQTLQCQIKEEFPLIPAQYHLDAICWHWRLDWFHRLVRSSQMQLRVMAANSLCCELITLWRAYKSRENADSSFLEHIGLYLMHIGLVDYILDANCHPEIIVESANVLGFLAVTKQYCKAHTDRFWICLTTSQDPRVSGALDRMMKSILNLLEDGVLIDLCEKLQHLPLEDISSHMRLVWDSAMNEIIKRCHSDRRVPPLVIFHICLRLLKESSIITTSNHVRDVEMNQAATRHLKELFAYGPSGEDRDVLLISCIEDIANKTETTLGSLGCLTLLMGQIASTQREQIEDLTKRFDLSALIVEELSHAANVRRNSNSATVLAGDSNIPRQHLLTVLAQHSPDSLRIETARELLDHLVGTKSTCEEDRSWGWNMLISVMKKTSLQNSLLQTCLSSCLPTLPPRYFSAGMLELLLERVLKYVTETQDFAIDEPNSLENSGIELLWRFALKTPDEAQASKAVSSIAVDVYLESTAIRSCSPLRSSNIHASLVQRCLKQMNESSCKLRGFGDGVMSDDDETMVIVATDEEVLQAGLTFSRSLQLLRLFIEQHQQRPQYAMADLRPLMARVPGPTKGDPAGLKVQQFDGNGESAVESLPVGRRNSMSSLLAIVRDTTGFQNFRLFFGGKQLFPRENEAGQTIETLRIHDGLLIVKREDNRCAPISRMKPGSSPLEIDILSGFEDLWNYLSLDEDKSQEMFDFLVRLPISGRHVDLFESDSTTFADVILPGEPFKSLYAVHAVGEYIDSLEAKMSLHQVDPSDIMEASQGYTASVTRLLTLFMPAVSRPEVLQTSSMRVHLQLTGALWKLYVKLLSKILASPGTLELRPDMMPSPQQVTKVLNFASAQLGDASLALVENVFSAILKISAADPAFGLAILSAEDFMNSFRHIILEDPRKAVRQSTGTLIQQFCEARLLAIENQGPAHPKGESGPSTLTVVKKLCSTAIGFMKQSVSYPLQCEDFFGSLQVLLRMVLKEDPCAKDIDSLVTEAATLLLDHFPTEYILQPNVVDYVAAGLVSTLHLCLLSGKAILQSDAFSRTGTLEMLWHLLFPRRPRPENPTDRPSVILSTDIREKLCDIVFEFSKKDDTQLRLLLKLAAALVPFYPEEPDDPYLYDLPYQFDRNRALRAKCGYAGLKNLSNTCYLNSLLTQLFMNMQFRTFVMSLDTDPTSEQNQLLFYIQQLFAFMQGSYEKFIDPTSVVGAIRTYEDAPIDIHNQMDVDEFYNLLFDRLENQMPDAEEKRRLRSFFGGQLVQQVKSRECEHISERLEPFSAIQCDIKGKATLQESLQAYVDGEVMEGENRYKCTSCDQHVDAVKRTCLKDVPDNVIFHLKRFDFCLRTLQRRKINDHFSFPLVIDLAPYTIDSLAADTAETQRDDFELAGILVHAGGAESGHYYSYIRERSGSSRTSWIECNDDTVSPWDPSLMESMTFGGAERAAETDAGFSFEKSYSAYMLFYQRASRFRSCTEGVTVVPAEPTVPQRLRAHIVHENALLLRRHCLFDSSHSSLVQRLFQYATSKCCEQCDDDGDKTIAAVPDHNAQNLAMELALLYFDQMASRMKANPAVEEYRSMILAAVASCAHCALSCFDFLTDRAVIVRSLIHRNSDQRVKAFAGQVLVQSYTKLRRHGSGVVTEMSPDSRTSDVETGMGSDDGSSADGVIQGTLKTTSFAPKLMFIFDYLWKFFPTQIRSWDEQFYAMLTFARQGSLETEHVLSANYLVKLMYMIMADTKLEMPVSYTKMLNALTRRFNKDLPSYAAIIELIDELLGQMEPSLGVDVIVETPEDRTSTDGRFMWTSREVETIFLHPDEHKSSFFVEKLLDHGQCLEVVNSIIAKLVATGEEMDVRVLGALRKRFRNETAEYFEATLSVTSQYLESSLSTERALTLARNTGDLASTLQHQEGLAFVKFMRAVLHPSSSNTDRAKALRLCGLEMIPAWAPYLLMYRDVSARRSAEELIREELFPEDVMDTVTDLEDQQEAEDEMQNRAEVIQRLGIKLLEHLRDKHVLGRTPIERGAAGCISRMIDDCSTLFRMGDGSDDSDDAKAAYEVIRAEIMEAVQRVTVDEMEDDMSDWDGSLGSSELMELNIAVQATMDERKRPNQ